jgi:hypothetical protein
MTPTRRIHVKIWCCTVFLLVGVSLVRAADLPKEGGFDVTSCWSGASSVITFDKTHTASSSELIGTSRSNPPGGPFDMTSFRCVGLTTSIEGKNTATSLCEIIDNNGDKFLVRNAPEGPKQMSVTLAGTGKYEGMVRIGTSESLGQFPATKPGTFQGCSRQSGTYKLK